MTRPDPDKAIVWEMLITAPVVKNYEVPLSAIPWFSEP